MYYYYTLHIIIIKQQFSSYPNAVMSLRIGYMCVYTYYTPSTCTHTVHTCHVYYAYWGVQQNRRRVHITHLPTKTPYSSPPQVQSPKG